MKCPRCDASLEEAYAFCPACGFSFADDRAQVEQTVREEHLAEKRERISSRVRGPLLLTICILVSVAVFASFLGQTSNAVITEDGVRFSVNLPVFEILFTIFLWIAYAKGQSGTLKGSHLRTVSGTIFAQCVVNYVAGGILLVVGAVLPTWLVSNTQFRQTMIAELERQGIDFFALPYDFFFVFSVVLTVVLVGLGLFLILITAFGYRYIHRFAKSLHRRLTDGETPLVSIGSARGWLIVFGVFDCLAALANINNLWLFLANGALGAAMFVGSALVARISDELE